MTTLNDIRDRIRTQIEAASGLTEEQPVNQSDITLAGLRRRVRSRLQDLDAGTWSNEDVDEAIRTALEQYSKYAPDHAITTVTLGASDAREVDISTVTDALRIEKVWWDYDDASPSYPPNYRQFEVWPGQVLYINDREEPAEYDVVRLWYTKMHTVNGLDAATATTIPLDDEGTIVTGAVHFASQSRLAELIETLPAHDDVLEELRRFADEQGTNFRFQAQIELRQYIQRQRAYDQGDIDEAVRWALHRISEVKPHRAITTETLSSPGREIAFSGTTFIDIERVWLEYDASDPDHPPRWADFEMWPGDIIFINEPEEPQANDVLRIWYTASHTINGLDSETTTTLIDREVNTLIVGATGYAAQERVQEEEQYWGKRDLRDWAEARLREFEDALERLARRQAIKHSGVAQVGDLDRWDGDWS
jgi:hypothetical protein